MALGFVCLGDIGRATGNTPVVTGRLPFDPGRMASAKSKPDDGPWSVSALAQRIDSALQNGLPKSILVQGEISGFRDRTHWYFDLKDESAVVSITMFASAAKRSRAKPVNGQEFVVKGRVEFYAAGGRTSVIATSITPVGLGVLEQRYQALCAELQTLGWFAQERKRPLPIFPRRIAIVTSRTGAALQDVLDTARRRMPGVELVLVDVRVQGAQAADEIAQAVNGLSRKRNELEIDAILVTRGGGSMEDLWAFNERVVAEAIVACPVPVVAAIGHETDTTIAELVADERCATPTQAAMKMIPDRTALQTQLGSIERRLQSDIRRQLEAARQIVSMYEKRPALASPDGLLSMPRARLDRCEQSLAREVRRRIEQARERIRSAHRTLARMSPHFIHAQRRAALEANTIRLHSAITHRIERSRDWIDEFDRHLHAVSPFSVLERGYSITTSATGRVVREATEVKPGEHITTRLKDGTIRSTVDGMGDAPTPTEITQPSSPPPRRRRRSRTNSDTLPQLDLFEENP